MRDANSHLPTHAITTSKFGVSLPLYPVFVFSIFLDDIHAVYYLAKNHMFSIEEKG